VNNSPFLSPFSKGLKHLTRILPSILRLVGTSRTKGKECEGELISGPAFNSPKEKNARKPLYSSRGRRRQQKCWQWGEKRSKKKTTQKGRGSGTKSRDEWGTNMPQPEILNSLRSPRLDTAGGLDRGEKKACHKRVQRCFDGATRVCKERKVSRGGTTGSGEPTTDWGGGTRLNRKPLPPKSLGGREEERLNKRNRS